MGPACCAAAGDCTAAGGSAGLLCAGGTGRVGEWGRGGSAAEPPGCAVLGVGAGAPSRLAVAGANGAAVCTAGPGACWVPGLRSAGPGAWLSSCCGRL